MYSKKYNNIYFNTSTIIANTIDFKNLNKCNSLLYNVDDSVTLYVKDNEQKEFLLGLDITNKYPESFENIVVY